jgi:hypothetical protein
VTQTCSKCQLTKPLGEFYTDKSKKLGVHGTCKECVRADRKARYDANPEKYNRRCREYAQTERGKAARRRAWLKLRGAALDAYGNKCACCGEHTEEFLTIDHVGGWGSEHRDEIGSGASNIYQWLRKAGYPKDGTIQLLCWNCNCALGVRGYCPHQTNRKQG